MQKNKDLKKRAKFDNKLQVNFEQNLNLASSLHKTGNLQEAKILYEELLSVGPKNFQVLHFLGTLEAQLGNLNRGVNLLQQAIGINSEFPEIVDTLELLAKGYQSL